MKQLSEKQQQVLEHLLSGTGVRKTAVQVFGKSSKESTVRNWRDGILAPYLEEGYQKVAEEAVQGVEQEIIDTLCEHQDVNVSKMAKSIRTYQRENNRLRKVQRDMLDKGSDIELINNSLGILAASIGKLPSLENVRIINPDRPIKKKVVEILFSDLQIGKVNECYDTPTAKKALRYYGAEVLKIVMENNPEEIVFASIGDIVEDHLKHGVQSATSTDTGLAEQMADAMEGIWKYVLRPLAALGIPMTVIGVAGNHGTSTHKGMDMFKAGRFCYDYAMYKALELLCQASNAKHVKFVLPEGCFATHTIFGQKYLYEHGYFNGCTEASLLKQKEKRMNNLKTFLHGIRVGDMHHVCLYDNSNLVVNGAFFGIETTGQEYSGILGFNAIPAQVVMVHEPVPEDAIGLSTVSETKVIQIAKGY